MKKNTSTSCLPILVAIIGAAVCFAAGILLGSKLGCPRLRQPREMMMGPGPQLTASPMATEAAVAQPNANDTEQTTNIVRLTCDNTDFATARYWSENGNAYLDLTMFNSASSTDYSMSLDVSGSGAKYTTVDGSMSFWEHQGEFTLYKNDLNGESTVVTVCTADDSTAQ